MKKLIFLFVACMSLLACSKDPCAEQECLNGGSCLDGSCDCPDGFIGPDCGIVLDPCANKDCDVARTDSCIALSSSEARCVCKEGFEGERCENSWEDKYIGAYNCLEDCDGSQINFPMTIEEGPDLRTLALVNFHNQTGIATKVVADLVNAQVLDMSLQYMAFGIVYGGGSRETNGSVGLTYRVINGADTLQCSAYLSPQ